MKLPLRAALGAVLLTTCLLPSAGHAAMVRRSLEQLSQEADTIVIGTIARQVSSWNNEGTRIVTDVTVTVEESIKGHPAVELTFRVAGGSVAGLAMRTSNDPAFKNGDRLILFLHTVDVPARLVGHSQGAYRVHDELVVRDGHSMAAREFINAIRATNP